MRFPNQLPYDNTVTAAGGGSATLSNNDVRASNQAFCRCAKKMVPRPRQISRFPFVTRSDTSMGHSAWDHSRWAGGRPVENLALANLLW